MNSSFVLYRCTNAATKAVIPTITNPTGPEIALIADENIFAIPPAFPIAVDNFPATVTILPTELTRFPITLKAGPIAAIKAKKVNLLFLVSSSRFLKFVAHSFILLTRGFIISTISIIIGNSACPNSIPTSVIVFFNILNWLSVVAYLCPASFDNAVFSFHA